MPSWKRVYQSFQSDMNIDKKIIHLSLAEVKRNLDPALSYMVFERDMCLKEANDFSEVIEALSRLRRGELEWELYSDELSGKDFLVVKVEPGQDKLIMDEIIDTGLPEDLTCFLYRGGTRV